MSTLLVQKDGSLTRLSLNRSAKANALDEELVEELLNAVSAAYVDGTRFLVLQPGPKNFSAGFDFTGALDAGVGHLLWRFVRIEQLLQAIFHAPFATMAIARGRNFGAGADLFIACDIRVAEPETSFRMPGFRFGLQLGTRRLAQRVGNEAARSILAESKTIGAIEAGSLGLATTVSKAERWGQLITAEQTRATALSPDSVARLRAATIQDTRKADMADLVASITIPGMKSRISSYLEDGAPGSRERNR
jgi:enoyl-CoA hydratase/carnithine racemase